MNWKTTNQTSSFTKIVLKVANWISFSWINWIPLIPEFFWEWYTWCNENFVQIRLFQNDFMTKTNYPSATPVISQHIGFQEEYYIPNHVSDIYSVNAIVFRRRPFRDLSIRPFGRHAPGFGARQSSPVNTPAEWISIHCLCTNRRIV